MDPNANLAEQLKLAQKIIGASTIGYTACASVEEYEADVDRLCELVTALDEWIARGGFLPDRWRKQP